jgi:hypothetical protein
MPKLRSADTIIIIASRFCTFSNSSLLLFHLLPHLRLAAERRDDVDDAQMRPALSFHRAEAFVVGVDALGDDVVDQRPDRDAEWTMTR